MTCNILVSRPLKCHLPMQAGGYYLLCYYILFCTKPTYLTARAWPFSIDFNDNNLDAVPKNARGRGTGNYYITLYQYCMNLIKVQVDNTIEIRGQVAHTIYIHSSDYHSKPQSHRVYSCKFPISTVISLQYNNTDFSLLFMRMVVRGEGNTT